MREGSWNREVAVERLAVGVLLFAMASAATLLIWESRGLTLLVDEWSWGFGGRTNFDLHAFVDPHNGHFVAVPVLITKVSLQVFHANVAVPLRLLAVSLHLAVAGCFFLLTRQAIGTAAAVLPTVLVLFLGAANDGILGSHGMSVTITVLMGLGAWLAIQRRQPTMDVLAAALLTIGVATESTTLPFVLGAATMIALQRGSSRSRYWVPAVPLLVYVLWWSAWGHVQESDFAIANLAGLPAFAFDSLAAALAAVTGVFTTSGSRSGGFDLSAGKALAGGLLVVVLALSLGRRYRPGIASKVPLVTLLSFWLLTSSVASPLRVPWASRYLYISAILFLLVLAQEIGTSPVRRRAAIALSVICAFALPPNIREITYAADGVRLQAEINRAVMGASELLVGDVPGTVLLEDPADVPPGQVADLGYSLEQYAASKRRFGAPAFTMRQIEGADPIARAAADRMLARALSISVVPAQDPPHRLPPDIRSSQTGGALRSERGCFRFVPLTTGAQVSLELPTGGLWIRPALGEPVPIGVARFAESFGFPVGRALGGRASVVTLPHGRASRNWRAQLTPTQRLIVCAA